MKHLLQTLILTLPFLSMNGQSKVGYSYDASGNRIATKQIEIKILNNNDPVIGITMKSDKNHVYFTIPQEMIGAKFSAFDASGNMVFQSVINTKNS